MLFHIYYFFIEMVISPSDLVYVSYTRERFEPLSNNKCIVFNNLEKHVLYFFGRIAKQPCFICILISFLYMDCKWKYNHYSSKWFNCTGQNLPFVTVIIIFFFFWVIFYFCSLIYLIYLLSFVKFWILTFPW